MRRVNAGKGQQFSLYSRFPTTKPAKSRVLETRFYFCIKKKKKKNAAEQIKPSKQDVSTRYTIENVKRQNTNYNGASDL